jgi:uncharacterized phiE125 gp8 family phage protein
MRNVWVKTDVTAEPVTVQEAKLFCKVTGTGDDALFSMFIRQARENLEQDCGVSIAEKTLISEWDKIPSNGIIQLPYGPVKSITAVTIKYEDSTDADETLDLNDDYFVTKTPWSELRVGYLSVYSRARLRVEYITGYGATNCPPLPYPLKTAICKEILTEYYIRENINADLVISLKKESRAMAYPYRRTLWFAPEA